MRFRVAATSASVAALLALAATATLAEASDTADPADLAPVAGITQAAPHPPVSAAPTWRPARTLKSRLDTKRQLHIDGALQAALAKKYRHCFQPTYGYMTANQLPRTYRWRSSKKGITLRYARGALSSATCGTMTVTIPWKHLPRKGSAKGKTRTIVFVGKRTNASTEFPSFPFVIVTKKGKQIDMVSGYTYSEGTCDQGVLEGKKAHLFSRSQIGRYSVTLPWFFSTTRSAWDKKRSLKVATKKQRAQLAKILGTKKLSARSCL